MWQSIYRDARFVIKPLITLIATFLVCGAYASYLAESRIKIAVVDTGLTDPTQRFQKYLCKEGNIDLTGGDNPMSDSSLFEHGTNIVGLITKNLDYTKYCVLIIKFYPSLVPHDNLVPRAVLYAVEQGAAFINLSLGGNAFEEPEYQAIKFAIEQGVNIAAAAGNGALNLNDKCSFYPACYAEMPTMTRIHVVGSNTFIGRPYSNFGRVVRYYEDGTNRGNPPLVGTSQATAIHMNKWVRGLL
jgi:hypothetical protein